jgi:hypothetical protein
VNSPLRLHIRINRTRTSQPLAVFLMVIEIAIQGIAVSPHSADTARPLIAPGGPTLPVAPLAQRLASGLPNLEALHL